MPPSSKALEWKRCRCQLRGSLWRDVSGFVPAQLTTGLGQVSDVLSCVWNGGTEGPTRLGEPGRGWVTGESG